MSNANKTQIGGSHYKNASVPDHWDIVIALEWDYLLGAATKYLWRLGKKGGPEKALQDLDKAIHYLHKKREVMAEQLNPRKQVEIVFRKRELDADDGSEPGAGYVNQD
jgi:hypothetical protein